MLWPLQLCAVMNTAETAPTCAVVFAALTAPLTSAGFLGWCAPRSAGAQATAAHVVLAGSSIYPIKLPLPGPHQARDDDSNFQHITAPITLAHEGSQQPEAAYCHAGQEQDSATGSKLAQAQHQSNTEVPRHCTSRSPVNRISTVVNSAAAQETHDAVNAMAQLLQLNLTTLVRRILFGWDSQVVYTNDGMLR